MDSIGQALFGLVIFGTIFLASSSAQMSALRRRLQRRGVWFPVMVWLATFALYVVALMPPRAAIRLPPELGLLAVVASPLLAAVLTLAWRDARAGVVEAEAAPAAPEDAPASHGVRLAAGVFAFFSAVALALSIPGGEWKEGGAALVIALIFGRVAWTGRAPARFRGSI